MTEQTPGQIDLSVPPLRLITRQGCHLCQAARDTVAAEAAQGQVCEAANDNDPAQVVVSGHRAAVERAVELAKSRGAKRALLLPVSAPFHCSLMQPAADAMAAALADVAIARPKVPLVSNVKAEGTQDPEEIRRLLVEQVTGRVRWRESVLALASRRMQVRPRPDDLWRRPR